MIRAVNCCCAGEHCNLIAIKCVLRKQANQQQATRLSVHLGKYFIGQCMVEPADGAAVNIREKSNDV